MANVSISKAAKLAGISRTSLYRTYIDQGRVTVSKDSVGKKYIETSELLRVFGELKLDAPSVTKNNTETVSTSATAEVNNLKIQAENTLLKQQIEELKQDKAWYQSQIQNLTDTMKHLEAPKKSHFWKKFWKS